MPAVQLGQREAEFSPFGEYFQILLGSDWMAFTFQ